MNTKVVIIYRTNVCVKKIINEVGTMPGGKRNRCDSELSVHRHLCHFPSTLPVKVALRVSLHSQLLVEEVCLQGARAEHSPLGLTQPGSQQGLRTVTKPGEETDHLPGPHSVQQSQESLLALHSLLPFTFLTQEGAEGTVAVEAGEETETWRP